MDIETPTMTKAAKINSGFCYITWFLQFHYHKLYEDNPIIVSAQYNRKKFESQNDFFKLFQLLKILCFLNFSAILFFNP